MVKALNKSILDNTLITFVSEQQFPHYQALSINTKDILDILQKDLSLYNEELQAGLMKFELHKMPITVNQLCNNNSPKFKNDGGFIHLGLGDNNDAKRNKNSNAFSTLKGISVYDKYLFGNVTGDDILGVYGDLYYLYPDLKVVKTYTIVYIVSEAILREVTLHDFGVYGNILTRLDLKLN